MSRTIILQIIAKLKYFDKLNAFSWQSNEQKPSSNNICRFCIDEIPLYRVQAHSLITCNTPISMSTFHSKFKQCAIHIKGEILRVLLGNQDIKTSVRSTAEDNANMCNTRKLYFVMWTMAHWLSCFYLVNILFVKF